MKAFFKVIGLFGVILGVQACTTLLPIGNEPEQTFSLRYEGAVPGDNKEGPVLFVDSPAAVEGLGGQTIRVELLARERRALDNARWSAPLPDLVRDYINRLLQAQTAALVTGEGERDIPADCRLALKLWHFELHPGAQAAEDQISVGIEAHLIAAQTGLLLGRRQFDEKARVLGKGGRDVVEAFHQAMAAAGRDMSSWVREKLPACRL